MIKSYVTNPHAVLLSIGALLIAGWQGAYVYLNPSNFQLDNAIVYGGTAILTALVLGHHIVSTAAKTAKMEAMIETRPTISTPVQRPPREDN